MAALSKMGGAHPLRNTFEAAIEEIEDLIQESLDRLIYHFKKAHVSHQVVHLNAGFAALTSNAIHKYVFRFDPGNIDKGGFNAKVRDSINGLFQLAHIRYCQPYLATIESGDYSGILV
ncbi:uncharacterized protein NFIA_096200 [Aspergillus fischeri NRRL 181]|uniref:Uncharacterized protein n=1 Tax=Neosartorya fischeri (strain ATCC 1020 / DSM 3700 / CBS 544.65 / FGSC A1164 / JCM 1740 / NRRL 181 / WB 181) TaxID=331117 RepID=A1DAV9_NEOFI|nr:uncharacterized protein NFIA_096200 [Aspergillus fischeri NRRL 181]EAW19999.1 hypothetical protein NFIA_096200 [Aspergillus fischeri NRRL 181]